MNVVEFQGLVRITLPAGDGINCVFGSSLTINLKNVTGVIQVCPNEGPGSLATVGQHQKKKEPVKPKAGTSPQTPDEEAEKTTSPCRELPSEVVPPPKFSVDEAAEPGTKRCANLAPIFRQMTKRRMASCTNKTSPASISHESAQNRPEYQAVWEDLGSCSPSGLSRPSGRWGCSLTPIGDDKLFLYGGDDGDAALAEVWMLSTGAWTWQKLQLSLPGKARAWHTATYLAPKLVVFGGEAAVDDNGLALDKPVNFNDVSIFDTEYNLWYSPPVSGQPPAPRSGHSMTALLQEGGARLLVLAGTRDGKWLNDAHVLDTVLMSWYRPIVRGTPPKARSYHSATLVGSKVVVFGGNGSSKCFQDVHVLETASEPWTWQSPETVGPVPAARTGHSAVALEDGRSVAVYGGWDYKDSYSSSAVFGDVTVLDTETWQWRVCAVAGSPPEPRAGHASCVAPLPGGERAALVFGGQLKGERKADSLLRLTVSELPNAC